MATNLTSAVGAGMGSGLDINGIIDQLVSIQRRPINALQMRQDDLRTQITALSSVRNKVDAIRTAANSLADSTSLAKWAATSSNSDIATVAATGNAAAGSLAFRVTRTASTHSMRSTLTVTDTVAAGGATSASTLAVARGLGSMGIRSLSSNNVAAGTLSVSVTRASQAAVKTGTGIGALTTIDATNDSFAIEVDGGLRTVTLAHGTYDRSGLFLALQNAFQTAGVDDEVAVTLNGSNQLQLSSIAEGSAATLRVAGGSANAALGLATDAVAVAGIDGALTINGVSATVNNARSGATLSVSVGGGTMDVTLDGALRAGSGSGKIVSAGDGSLASVVTAINDAAVGVKAQAVKVGANSYRLQLGSDGAGSAKRVNIDSAAFAPMGGLVAAQAGENAQLTIGTGTGAYTVESATGVFDGVLSGWSITAKSVSATEVTATVNRDTQAVADRVDAFVKAVNDTLNEIKTRSKYSSSTSSGGALAGDASIRSVASNLQAAFRGSVSQSGIPGVSFTRQGTLSFDTEAFKTAYEADPTAVAAIINRTGTATDTGVRFDTARTETKAGSYAVSVTQVATKATSATAFVGGAGADTRVQVRRGSTTVTYDVLSGQSAESIVTGVNDALRAGGLSVRATNSAGGVQLVADSYGSAASFDVNWDVNGAGSFDTATGLDVAGTIDGQTATGVGRYLSLATDSTSNAKGLRVEISGTATGSRGTVTYAAGIAGLLSQTTSTLLTANTGTLALAEQGRQTRITAFDRQIASMEQRVSIRETMLRKQYANLDTTLNSLKGQSNWLSQQINSMNPSK